MNANRAKGILLAAVMALGAIGVYGIFAWQGNSSPARAAEEGAALGRHLAKGPMALLHFLKERRDVSSLKVFDGKGGAHTLGEWKGKVLFVNFWATWCPPCRREMPEIGRLQAAFPKEDFRVIAVSEDRKGYEWAAQGLKVLDGDNLLLMMDRNAEALRRVNPRATLPTTVLVDRQGRAFAVLVGPAAWASAEARAVIRAAIAEK